jgi:hypothetical protein
MFPIWDHYVYGQIVSFRGRSIVMYPRWALWSSARLASITSASITRTICSLRRGERLAPSAPLAHLRSLGSQRRGGCLPSSASSATASLGCFSYTSGVLMRCYGPNLFLQYINAIRIKVPMYDTDIHKIL